MTLWNFEKLVHTNYTFFHSSVTYNCCLQGYMSPSVCLLFSNRAVISPQWHLHGHKLTKLETTNWGHMFQSRCIRIMRVDKSPFSKVYDMTKYNNVYNNDVFAVLDHLAFYTFQIIFEHRACSAHLLEDASANICSFQNWPLRILRPSYLYWLWPPSIPYLLTLSIKYTIFTHHINLVYHLY